MALFWGVFFSFPVIIFSTLLTLCVLYWLVAAIGIFNLDCLDVDVDFDGGDIPSTGLGGLLLKLGFNNIPMTLLISLLSLFGWISSYLISRYLLIYIVDLQWIFYLAGLFSLLISFVVAIYLTKLVVKPLKPFFNKLASTSSHRILCGQTVEIRSGIVNKDKGEATYEDGGAGLILQVRAEEHYQFKRGDKAILLSYDSESNSYEIISESDFIKDIK